MERPRITLGVPIPYGDGPRSVAPGARRLRRFRDLPFLGLSAEAMVVSPPPNARGFRKGARALMCSTRPPRSARLDPLPQGRRFRHPRACHRCCFRAA